MDFYDSKYTAQGLSQYGLQAAAAQFGSFAYKSLKRKHQALKDGGKTKEGTATKTVTTTEEEDKTTSVMPSEHKRFRYRRGRKPKHNLKQAWKMLKSTVEPVYLRLQHMNPYCTTACGAQKLFNLQNTNASYVRMYMPCHIYDVSAFMNNVGGALAYGEVGPYTPTFSSGGVTRYENVQLLKDSGDADRLTWGCESTSHTTTAVAQAPHRRSIWDWLEFRLLCYGRTTLPTRWRIQLVQFRDENLHPRQFLDNQPDTETLAKAQEFWNSYLSPMMVNPIEAANVEARKGMMKVLKSIDFVMASSRNDDGTIAGIPLIQEIRGFHRMNRMQKYDWDAPKRENIYTTNNGQNQFTVNDSNCEPYVAPMARVYLVVSAQSSGGTYAAANPPLVADFLAASQPSYDILLRVRHSIDD